MLQVTVKRSEWYRGRGSNESRLLSSQGRCCLGFATRDAGVKDVLVQGKSCCSDIPIKFIPESLKLLVIKDSIASDPNSGDDQYLLNSEVGRILMHINDTPVGNHIGLRIGEEIEAIWRKVLGAPPSPITSEAHREELLTKVGKLANIEFTFVD